MFTQKYMLPLHWGGYVVEGGGDGFKMTSHSLSDASNGIACKNKYFSSSCDYEDQVESCNAKPTTLAPEPTTTKAPKPETTQAPEPTTTVAPEPETTQAPEPTEEPEPETTEGPEPTTTEASEPETTEEPEPETTQAPEPETTVSSKYNMHI